ncbi:MAG: hypothetical protein WD069_15405 [Planctomycetales bacterium]
MNEQDDLLFRVIDRLDAAGIPYMVVGSYASAAHGEPRSTNDADVVIDPTIEQLTAFLRSAEEREYVSESAARDALRRRSMFNVIDTLAGAKVDLICRKEQPFHVEEFERRSPRTVRGRQVFAASAEDTLLSKLVWAKRSDSERQIRDAAGIVRVSGPLLDREYLERWAEELDVADELRELLAACEDAEGDA